jgi:hypothetical protein
LGRYRGPLGFGLAGELERLAGVDEVAIPNVVDPCKVLLVDAETKGDRG